jgi:inner membrane protein
VTHCAPALALAAGLGRQRLPGRLLAAALVASILPDLDVVAFRLGIPYQDIWGHRGFSHSLVFAFLGGGLALWAAPWLGCRRISAFLLISAAMISHLALDAATSGGLGVAAFWPFSPERYFLPWRPVRVSPLSLQALLSARGAAVFWSEMQWVWLPCLALAGLLRLFFKLGRRDENNSAKIANSGGE